ncbi:MAG: DUF6311 domain-containing protein [Gemmiger sp.]|uniref:DUF6311 domain-containing protein n=1 Tax=Gemmiger sp. TaxID=2049027 RepID=UPI002A90EF57|nr:DUF6311 domain-containing protein [Gemmiger sp.]MDY5411915.1 DUF6311 domain-containing protein [Gemmiger sp.]
MAKTKAFLQKHRWSLTGALLGALVFLILYGVRVLDPTCVDWILNNPSPDPAQHYLGWVFYRRSGWHLPYLGANYSAIYPYRTSILYTDSIPLLAVLGKLLGGVLPARFQYLGLWGLFCYAMQGGLAQALIARVGGVRPGDTAKNWASVLGAGVLVLFPALNIRMFAHTALAANWLVLLALWLWLCAEQSENRPTAAKLCLWWGILGLLCAGIHLYYLPMVGMVLVAACVQRALEKRGPAAVVLPVASFCGAALAELFVLGAFAANFAGYSNGYLSGADLANLFVPGLGASWEQEIYAGLGTTIAVVLALAGLLVQHKQAGAFFRRHKNVVIAALVLLVLDAIAATGNTVTFAGRTLFTVPIPQALMDFWAMFSSCARLAWLAGMLLAVAACGLVLRFWQGAAAAVLLALCTAAQGFGQRAELAKRFAAYHDATYYENTTQLTDPAWEQLAASGQFTHLAFASFDFEHDEFWDLAAFAADHGWTSNSFYMGHMDGNLAAVTLAGEMNALAPDTLYAFVDEDALARNNFALHYYRLDGVLLGSVEPINGLTEESADTAPAHTMTLEKSSVINGTADADGVVLSSGGELLTEAWMLFPGNYRVTLTGSGFDHSYIYARHGLINQETYKMDVNFTGIAPDEMVFEFSTGEPLYYWRTAVHALDDTPLTITAIKVEKLG